MTYTLNLTSERLSATIILKVSPGSHRVLLSTALIRSTLCTLIQRQWHQQAGRLISSSRIKACGAACEEPLTLSSCRSSTRLSLCSAHLPPLLKKPARPGHRRARGPDREAEGNYSAASYSDMLGNRKKAAPLKNGAGTSESKAIDPLRNLGEGWCYNLLNVANDRGFCLRGGDADKSSWSSHWPDRYLPPPSDAGQQHWGGNV